MPEFTGQKDLRASLRILWRWRWLFLAFVVAAPLTAFIIESGNPKVYRSTALVGVNQTTVNTSLINGGGSFSTTNVDAIAQIVTTSPVAAVAADLLHQPGSAARIAGQVSASGDSTTNFVTISAEDRSPSRAAAIANAFAHAISLNLQSSAVSQIDASISGIEQQLSHLSRNDVATRPQLEQQLNQLRAARATQGSEAAILQPAAPSTTPAGPHVGRSVELALLIGILLGLGAVALAQNADRRLRTPDDLEALTDLQLLAAIPSSAFSGGLLDPQREDEEAFRMLGTALMYFGDRNLSSVLVTSPGEKDGKTTVATRLAVAMADAGLHVILVDADLRRPQVSARLGMTAEVGLGGVLAGTVPLEDALVDFRKDAAGVGQLTVLPVGRPPSNPSALITSDEMKRAIRELESKADLVIIDTPAALAVSDPLALMRGVSGVLLVARMNRSGRQRVRRLQRIITAARGTLLGVVATGVTAGDRYEGYAYGYYAKAAANGTNGRDALRRTKPGSESDVTPQKPE